LPRNEVIAYLRENAGVLFDPNLTHVFLSFIEEEK
jgi:HD-GYP domain-containing protein (c-di-GMP phosphodiesterase class II)